MTNHEAPGGTDSPQTQPETETEEVVEVREPVFNLPPVVVCLIFVCAVVHLVRLYVLTDDQDFALIVNAAFFPILYTGGYGLDVTAFTRPVSYSLLHGSMMHLVINMIWLAAFGPPLANRLGAARFALFWMLTAVAAAVLHLAIYPYGDAPLIGASGAISGMMGAAARFGFRIDRSERRAAFAGPVLPIGAVLRSRAVMTFLGVWFAINLVTGLVGMGAGAGEQIAWEAHIGGFVAGFAAIPWFARRRYHA